MEMIWFRPVPRWIKWGGRISWGIWAVLMVWVLIWGRRYLVSSLTGSALGVLLAVAVTRWWLAKPTLRRGILGAVLVALGLVSGSALTTVLFRYFRWVPS
jgi:hypothetical protein